MANFVYHYKLPDLDVDFTLHDLLKDGVDMSVAQLTKLIYDGAPLHVESIMRDARKHVQSRLTRGKTRFGWEYNKSKHTWSKV